MYHHPWERPAIIRLSPSGTYTARQECHQCGTVRNPISGEITTWGSRACRDRVHNPEDPTWADEMERLQEELETLKASGETIDPACARRSSPGRRSSSVFSY